MSTERLDAHAVLDGWRGRTIATVTGAPNRIIDVDVDDVLVGTVRSPAGQPVPLDDVSAALALFSEEGRVAVNVKTLGHRSAFCGAVLRTLARSIVDRSTSPPVIDRRPQRASAIATAQDRGAIRPWWTGDLAERLWMEITDRPDIGTDLHCPQRDTVGKPNPGYSMILFVGDGDVVVHYDRNRGAIVAWSTVRGEVETATTVWASHRGAVRRRTGGVPRAQPGWWLDLEGPFMLEHPITLAELRERGPSVLAAITESAGMSRPYAPFYAYGKGRELRPAQYYLTKLPASVAHLLDLPSVAGARRRSIGGPWREPVVSESAERLRQVDVDVEVVERGIRGHVETERALAEALEAAGVTPLSPRPGDPPFDLAWEHAGELWVLEVKSTTPANQERQLRLGLGQVLRYRSQLTARIDVPVRAVLAPEHMPADESWRSTCASADVTLVDGANATTAIAGLLSDGSGPSPRQRSAR